MYFTRSMIGFPAIRRDGRSVLSVWDRDWEFAHWLCRLLNEPDENPELFPNAFDRSWLKALDHAFAKEVHHARSQE